jgi:hypothetical protein
MAWGQINDLSCTGRLESSATKHKHNFHCQMAIPNLNM